MNEEPKSIWKKSWKGTRGLLIWFLLLLFAASIVFFCIGVISGIESTVDKLAAFAVLYAFCFALGGVLLIAFIYWLCCWRNFKRFLFSGACLATLIALFYAEEDWRGWHAWQKFKHQWEAKGERFDFASVIPPPVPDDQNFALTPMVASCYSQVLDKNGHPIQPPNTNVVDRLQMTTVDNDYGNGPTNDTGNWQKSAVTDLKTWQQYYRDVATRTNEFPVPAQPQSPATDVLLALSKYDPAIEELRQASRLPYSRFPLNYESQPPAAILLPHLAAMKRCSQVLRLRAIAELQNDQSEKSLDDIKLSLRLTDAIHTEPFLISHLVRIAMLQIMLQPVWEGLAEHRWSDAQLVELDRELARLDFLADYEFAVRGERALGIANIDYLRRTRELSMVSDSDDSRSSQPVQNIGFHLMPSAWFYQNELAIARMHQRWTLPSTDVEHQTVSPEEARRNEIAATDELGHLSFYYVFARILFPNLTSAEKKFACAQTSVNLARVAIALERYHLMHGDYPESLDALAPRFIDKLPHDIIGGQPSQGSGPASQPLHYRRTSDDQFVLYSVGWNETDDGGVVGLNKDGGVDINKGDWVWWYPQK